MGACSPSAVERTHNGVIVQIDTQDPNQARQVSLEVLGERLIHVSASPERRFSKKESLVVLPQQRRTDFGVEECADSVFVHTSKLTAAVSRKTGVVHFKDATGHLLLAEAEQGRSFQPIEVEGTRAYTVQQVFQSVADDEGLYGLGQHQSDEFNYKGKNEELFQYNTKVSVPFIVSTEGYGILWDSYSFCRFGNPQPYVQLGDIFVLRDKEGREGALTGTYVPAQGETLVRREDSLYFECNDRAAHLRRTVNLPENFRFGGSSVTYEGELEAKTDGLHRFLLYYAGYVKVYLDDKLVVSERWRAAWNPNSWKFQTEMQAGQRAHLRIEWLPDGDKSFLGLRAMAPVSEEQNRQMTWWSEMQDQLDYYFVAGETMDEIVCGYRTLTGKAPVMPKWAMGFWQSRERYKTQDELLSTLAEFRKRQIPIDNIVQDWNYWPEDQWGSHEFEASRYPDPQAMIDSVHQMHGRFMISVWPKFYVNTDNYKELDQNGWMYRQAVKDYIHDWVGPGYVGGFYDAYSPEARKVFWRQMDEKLYTGLAKLSNSKSSNDKLSNSKSSNSKFLDAWWMDASEPNVRDCTPMWYRKALCGPTALGTSTEYFNAYSLVNAMAIYEGQRSTWKTGKGNHISHLSSLNSHLSEPRVFLLTRSGFAGLQRYSTATWSGDIGTRWEDMRAQMTAGLSYSLSGIPFWGMDMGGFCVENRYVRAQQLFDRTGQENEDLKEWRELQTRWNQFGAFVPIFRSHGQWPLREIWNIAPDSHPAYRSFVYYDRLRYQLMPYLYSLAGWAHFRDYTLMRALVMDFGDDRNVMDIGDQWMLGPALMACPVGYYKARNRSVYFPKQTGWYNLYTGEKVLEEGEEEGNHISHLSSLNSHLSSRRLVVDALYERIPVFVREGAIIPFGPEMQWSDEKAPELIHLYIYAGQDGTFQLYEDEGTNYNYEQGRYATIDIRYDDAAKTVTFSQRKGTFPGMLRQRRFNVVLVTRDAPKPLNLDNPEGKMVQYSGKAVTVRL